MKYYANKEFLAQGLNHFPCPDKGGYIMGLEHGKWFFIYADGTIRDPKLSIGVFLSCVQNGEWVEVTNPFPRKIIAGVAIKGGKRGQENPKVYFVSSPGRHNTLIKIMADMFKLPIPISGEQGFITDTGEYVDRVEAKKLAIKYGQLLDPEVRKSDKKLYSEDLW
jgi:hypothetical protein